MGVAEHVETVRKFYAAGPAERDDERHPFATPDIVWHVPGENPVSGRWLGVRQVFEAMPAAMQPLDEWDVRVEEVMGNDDLVTAVVHLTGRRGDVRVDCTGAHVFRMDGDGRIAEAWGFVADQARLDDLFRVRGGG